MCRVRIIFLIGHEQEKTMTLQMNTFELTLGHFSYLRTLVMNLPERPRLDRADFTQRIIVNTNNDMHQHSLAPPTPLRYNRC